MTETDITPPDITAEDVTTAELIVWAGCKDTGRSDGFVDFWVHRRGTEIVEGKMVGQLGELLLKGRIDAKGHADIAFEPVKWTLLVEWQRHMQVLGNLYLRAFELMGCLPPTHGFLRQGVFSAVRRASRAPKEPSTESLDAQS